jgi:hypothetical protein
VARFLVLLLICCCADAAAGEIERLPVESFGKRPFLEDPELSPTGEMMAAKVDADGKEVVSRTSVAPRVMAWNS